MAQSLIFHATAPYSLFCGKRRTARPFWKFEDAEDAVASDVKHSHRIFERRLNGSHKQIYYMPGKETLRPRRQGVAETTPRG